MRLCLMTTGFLDRDWEGVLDVARAHGIPCIEACGGGFIPTTHLDPVALLASDSERAAFTAAVSDRGLEVTALSCHGNPLHPDPAVREKSRADLEASVRLAGALGIPHVNALAGCPGGGPDDRVPNWIIRATTTELEAAYAWQWEEQVLPYWTGIAELARAQGVVVCVEPHSGADVVYNVATFERLAACGDGAIAMNFDPSHLWWQGIDVLEVIARCADAIGTVHVKDTAWDPRIVRLQGVLSNERYDDWTARGWRYSTPGYGHGERDWAELVLTLRRHGYDGTLSVECEDPLLTNEDTLAASVRVLRSAIPAQPAPPQDWASNPGGSTQPSVR